MGAKVVESLDAILPHPQEAHLFTSVQVALLNDIKIPMQHWMLSEP